jgi:hypothetical protein
MPVDMAGLPLARNFGELAVPNRTWGSQQKSTFQFCALRATQFNARTRCIAEMSSGSGGFACALRAPADVRPVTSGRRDCLLSHFRKRCDNVSYRG